MTPMGHPESSPIPVPTLGRLPWYLAYVNNLRRDGVEHVSSTVISRHTGVEASQIAKDLSYIGIRGRTRIGYDVAGLARSLEHFLGFGQCHRAVIAGVGSLGSALIADTGLRRFGLEIVAGVDPTLAGRIVCGVPVVDSKELPSVVAETHAEIGILAVPVDRAQEVADSLVAAGVKALWNFTPCRLVSDPDIVVQDTSIYAHLAVMYHRLGEPHQS